MIAFHAVWDPPARGLRVWAETSQVSKYSSGGWHPFALGSASLAEYAGRFFGKGSVEKAASGELKLVLPTAGKKPCASPELGSAKKRSAHDVQPVPWRVATLDFKAGMILDFLSSPLS